MTDPTRRVLYGDNGKTLCLVPAGSIDMIYMDPPFGSDREYTGKHGRGFSDVWAWGRQEIEALAAMRAGENPVLDGVTYDTMSDPQVHGAVVLAVDFAMMARDARFTAYVLHMGVRLIHYKRVLKPTGNLVIHCDQTASHIVKAMVDAAFGRKNFRNEIIWDSTNTKKNQNSRNLPRSHDTILVWGRTDRPFFASEEARIAGSASSIPAHYKHNDHDGRGFYSTNTSLLASGTSGGESGQTWRGMNPALQGQGRHWSISQDARKELGVEHLGVLAALDALDAAGYIHWTKHDTPRLKQYARWYKGDAMEDIWTDMPALSPTVAERLGYPTQKPVALLERLIRLYCPEGGHVLDPFGGCGTTADAAERLGRSWTICDISIHAIDVIDRRMSDTHGIGEAHGLVIEGDWPGKDLAKINALPEAERRRYLSRLVGAASLDTDRKGDETQLGRGVHGHFSVKGYTGKEPHGLLMIAPTGGNVTDVDVLKKLVREDKAQFGVLLVDAVTDAMRDAAVKAGTWTAPQVGTYPAQTVDRIQFVTVTDAVAAGVSDTLPSGVKLNLPYVPAKRHDPTLFAA